MELVKGIFIGIGCLFLLGVGSCAMIGAGTVVAVNSAATAIGNEVERTDHRRMDYIDEHIDDARMEEWNGEDVTRNKTTHYENHHDY